MYVDELSICGGKEDPKMFIINIMHNLDPQLLASYRILHPWQPLVSTILELQYLESLQKSEWLSIQQLILPFLVLQPVDKNATKGSKLISSFKKSLSQNNVSGHP